MYLACGSLVFTNQTRPDQHQLPVYQKLSVCLCVTFSKRKYSQCPVSFIWKSTHKNLIYSRKYLYHVGRLLYLSWLIDKGENYYHTVNADEKMETSKQAHLIINGPIWTTGSSRNHETVPISLLYIYARALLHWGGYRNFYILFPSNVYRHSKGE